MCKLFTAVSETVCNAQWYRNKANAINSSRNEFPEQELRPLVSWEFQANLLTNKHWPLLRGAIVNRTYGRHKTLHNSLFFLTTFDPIYYGPPQYLQYSNGHRVVGGGYNAERTIRAQLDPTRGAVPDAALNDSDKVTIVSDTVSGPVRREPMCASRKY